MTDCFRSYISRRAVVPPVAAAVLALGAAGCATTGETEAAARQEIAAADATLRQAEQAGAPEHNVAALQRARDGLEAAQDALADGDAVLAERLAEEAGADAELAASLARTGEAEEAMQQIREDIETLRAEANR